MQYRFVLSLLSLLLSVPAAAQNATLEGYLQQGVTGNLALKEQRFQFEKSQLALRQARSLFLPRVGLDASYTLAAGGRTIEFPIGDLLNPVYATLNQMTGQTPGEPGAFPTVQNEEIQFLPNHFHDTKIRASQPLLNWEVIYNREVRKELITLQQAEVNVYQRQLVRDIKTAYYQYLQADRVVEIYRTALRLTEENLRVNESLLRNGKITKDAVYRAQAERSEVEAQLAEAQANRQAAANYFNFLLNQPLDTPITADTTGLARATTAPESNLTGRREELQKLESALRANQVQSRLGRSYRLPTIGHQLDVGYQGFGYTFSQEQQYLLYGISLQWNLFAGTSNRLKVQQNELDRVVLENQLQQTERLLELQGANARQQLTAARSTLASARQAETSAAEYFRLLNRRYTEGQASLIEFLDARTRLTSAGIRATISQYDVLVKGADLERVTAAYPLDSLLPTGGLR